MRLRECKKGLRVKDSGFRFGLGKIMFVDKDSVKVEYPQTRNTIWYETPKERRFLKRI